MEIVRGENMKRIFLCLSLLLIITGCTTNKVEKKSYVEISYTEYLSKMENQESFILYIGSANCLHCREFTPTLKNVIADYDLEVFYIDCSKLTLEQVNLVWDETNIDGTPTVVFVNAGKVKLFPRIEGTVSEAVLIQKLKSAGYIE